MQILIGETLDRDSSKNQASRVERKKLEGKKLVKAENSLPLTKRNSERHENDDS